MSNIPRAREALLDIANRLEVEDGLLGKADEIRSIVIDDMYRRTAARRAPIKSRPVTEAIKRRIISLADSTNLHGAEIAVALQLNPGRVSEVLQGDR